MTTATISRAEQHAHDVFEALAPDMRQLWQRFPPRAQPPTWPGTEQGRDELLGRLLAPPFTVGNRGARDRRRRGLVGVVDWLANQPGDTWQQRWLASGAEALGNADWWRPALSRLQSGSQRRGASAAVTSNYRVCLLLMVCADLIRPSLGWLLTPRAPQSLVPDLTRSRDPEGFAELAALCEASPAGRSMTMAAMRRAATIIAAKGGTVRDITVGDCLEMGLVLDRDSRRTNNGMVGFYRLLHQMGIFGPAAPSTLRAFVTTGQLSPGQMLDPYGIECLPVRDLLVAYLRERQPMLDHTSLRSLAFTLGRLFWRDLEIHHPGINHLNLPPDVAATWKQRVLTRTIRTTGQDGQVVEERRPRADGRGQLATVRAFYLDIAQWAMEEPARWVPWAARARFAGRNWPQPRNCADASPSSTNAPGSGCRSSRPSWPGFTASDSPRPPGWLQLKPLLRAACLPTKIDPGVGSRQKELPPPASGLKTPTPASDATSAARRTGRSGPGPRSKRCD